MTSFIIILFKVAKLSSFINTAAIIHQLLNLNLSNNLFSNYKSIIAPGSNKYPYPINASISIKLEYDEKLATQEKKTLGPVVEAGSACPRSSYCIWWLMGDTRGVSIAPPPTVKCRHGYHDAVVGDRSATPVVVFVVVLDGIAAESDEDPRTSAWKVIPMWNVTTFSTYLFIYLSQFSLLMANLLRSVIYFGWVFPTVNRNEIDSVSSFSWWINWNLI